MSEIGMQTMLLSNKELQLVLCGCRIENLLLPGDEHIELDEADAAQSLLAMARDGLMPSGPEGMLEYADELRDVLMVLRDCKDELILWSARDLNRPLCLYLAADTQYAVLLQADDIRPGYVKVRFASADSLCEDILTEALAAPLLPSEALRPQNWPWQTLSGDGVLLAGRRFVRGSAKHDSLVLVVRTVEGDELADLCDGVVETLPLCTQSLLPQYRRVNHDSG